VRGIYLILVTLGFSISTVVIFESVDFVGGTMGMGGMTGANYVDALCATLVIGGLLYLVSKSALQRCLDAVREDDRVAASLGINVVFVKVVAFAISAMVAGIAGALYAHYLGFIRPDTFDVELALFVVLYVILGGTNNMWGPLVGATIMTLLPEYIVLFKEWRPTVFAALIIIMLLIRPEGLLTFRALTTSGWHEAKRQIAADEK
jgi:branched-chain amino acid transport system permease protein